VPAELNRGKGTGFVGKYNEKPSTLEGELSRGLRQQRAKPDQLVT